MDQKTKKLTPEQFSDLAKKLPEIRSQKMN